MPITQEALKGSAELKLRPERLNYLDEMLAGWVKDDTRPTIVAKAMRYGTPIFEGVYGTSFTDTPLSFDTIFPIMSITKPVVAILLHILQENGLVDLVDPVRSYMPEFVKGGRDKVCIWHLLTHTGGVPEYDDVRKHLTDKLGLALPADGAPDEEWRSVFVQAHKQLGLPPCEEDGIGDAVYEHLMDNLPLTAEPGKVMYYNSRGYEIARQVIVKVTGEPIDAYARRALFEPLGMKDTYWRLPEDKWPRVVGRRKGVLGYPWATEKGCMENESGGGGLKSTVNDFIKIMEMMRCYGEYQGVRILSPASVRSMKTNHNTHSEGFKEFDGWGLGWGVKGNKKDDSGLLCSPNTIEHGGWAGTKVLADFDNGISYAFFSLLYEFDEAARPEDEKSYRPRFTNVLMSALL